jgi:hypothetical protein
MVRSARLVAVAVLALSGAVVPSATADPAPGCGGIAANPSVEETARNGAPDSYVFTPAAPVPPGTPAGKAPKLLTEQAFAVDGQRSAVIQTPDGKASTAYSTEKFVPGGVYTLSVSTGSYVPAAGPATGLRFFDVNGAQVQETKLVADHDAGDGYLAKQDFPAATAPAKAAAVKFFATTSAGRLRWDCVGLQLAAYSVKKEVQNPANGAWGTFATVTAGEAAHYRVTVTNEGTQDLTGITVQDPWCSGEFDPFALAGGATKQLTCDHPDLTVADSGHVNTAKVTGVRYPGGTLGDKTASATITVLPPPAIAKLGDFVWNDRNRDGIQDPDEPGLAGVKATLGNGTSVVTGPDGAYAFTGLEDGTYQVCFTAEGKHPTGKDTGDDAKDSDADPATGCADPRQLGPGKRDDQTVDVGFA